MPTVKELMRAGRKEELWQMCCGFLDLNTEQFMAIQKRLLLEQIELLNNSFIGRKIFGGTIPQNVDEFRKRAPLTTYKDYCPELNEKRDDALPVKPLLWQHTSGRSTEYPFKWENIKWVPLTPAMSHELSLAGAAAAILASCKHKGDSSGLKKGMKFIYAVAPRPYTSGTYAYIGCEEMDCYSLPPLDIAEKMPIEDRIQLGFKQALSQGLDFYFGIAVALVTIGEKLGQNMEKASIKSVMMDPRALARLARGMLRSKIAHRKLLPKDLWSVKGIFSSGTDGTVFKDVIYNSWGRYPLNLYSSTEAGVVATQTWDYEGMTFFPNINFLEFISEPEYEHWKADNSYVPQTILLDEVKPGQSYELVITNFHGSPLTRYRTNDVIRITSLSNNKLKIALPQMEFEGRVDDRLDISGFVRLTEKVIWQAISNTGIPYVDWAARKEKGVLHVFVELRNTKDKDTDKIARAIYAELKKMDDDYMYGNIEKVLNTMPIQVTLLPEGAFNNHINIRRSQGADLAHLKPRHINPSDKEIEVLCMTPAGESAKEPAKVRVPTGR
jgi:hypothetical protein